MKNSTLLPVFAALAFVFGIAACEQPVGEREDVKAETTEKSEEAEEEAVVSAEELIWVYRERGNRQCEGGGTSLDESSARLTGGGVKVHESRCGVHTDRMYAAVCGGATGDILLHLIGRDSLDVALGLGVDPADQVKYQHTSCPNSGVQTR